jgi:hypothetical protein
MAIDLLACTGDAYRAGNLRALRCINHPATVYLHCMKPLRKIVVAEAKSVSVSRLSHILGKVTGQTAFRETTLVALLRLGLDVMIS